MVIRVLVVDDSVVIRRLVVQALERDPMIEVVGTAADGAIAQKKFDQLRPDVITMDVEMPVMDGVEAVRTLRGRGVRCPIIMFSTLTDRGATATLDALAAGASDYVTKPANVGSLAESLTKVAEQLAPKIRALAPRSAVATVAPTASARASVATVAPVARALPPLLPTKPHAVRAVVLGSSTGGPEALSRLIAEMTTALPVPMLVVQHMPPVFTAQLALRLDRLGPSRVVEAVDRMLLEPGTIYIAPGDKHLELTGIPGRTTVRITHGEPVNFCRPSVDVMFRSALAAIGPQLLGVMLTGMGADGKAGAGALVEAGATMIAQDEESSVIWGMPGAVAMAGYAHRIEPITQIAGLIMGRVSEPGFFKEGVLR